MTLLDLGDVGISLQPFVDLGRGAAKGAAKGDGAAVLEAGDIIEEYVGDALSAEPGTLGGGVSSPLLSVRSFTHT